MKVKLTKEEFVGRSMKGEAINLKNELEANNECKE